MEQTSVQGGRGLLQSNASALGGGPAAPPIGSRVAAPSWVLHAYCGCVKCLTNAAPCRVAVVGLTVGLLVLGLAILLPLLVGALWRCRQERRQAAAARRAGTSLPTQPHWAHASGEATPRPPATWLHASWEKAEGHGGERAPQRARLPVVVVDPDAAVSLGWELEAGFSGEVLGSGNKLASFDASGP